MDMKTKPEMDRRQFAIALTASLFATHAIGQDLPELSAKEEVFKSLRLAVVAFHGNILLVEFSNTSKKDIALAHPRSLAGNISISFKIYEKEGNVYRTVGAIRGNGAGKGNETIFSLPAGASKYLFIDSSLPPWEHVDTAGAVVNSRWFLARSHRISMLIDIGLWYGKQSDGKSMESNLASHQCI
jgi:hypothetical protein